MTNDLKTTNEAAAKAAKCPHGSCHPGHCPCADARVALSRPVVEQTIRPEWKRISRDQKTGNAYQVPAPDQYPIDVRYANGAAERLTEHVADRWADNGPYTIVEWSNATQPVQAQGEARPAFYAHAEQIEDVGRVPSLLLTVSKERVGFCTVPLYTHPAPAVDRGLSEAASTALGQIAWSNDSVWQAQCARETLAASAPSQAASVGEVATMVNNPATIADVQTPGWKLHRCPDGEQCRASIGGGCASGWCGHFEVKPDGEGVPRFPSAPSQAEPAAEWARPITDEMMDLVDRLGSEWREVDPRAWSHLLTYAPKDYHDGQTLWLWRNGDHFLAFSHLYPCITPGGDPMVLGEPFGRAVFRQSCDRSLAHSQAGSCQASVSHSCKHPGFNPYEGDECLACNSAAPPAGRTLTDADRRDAGRYRRLRNSRETSLVIMFFGNGCINKTIDMVEAKIDEEIAASSTTAGERE